VLLVSCGGGGGSTDVGSTAATPQASAQTAPIAVSTAPTTPTIASNSAVTVPEAAQASAPATPYGQDANTYALTFSEDFNSYNSNLWNDHMWYEKSNATKNFTVEDGKLKIWPQRDGSGKFFNRTIDTDGKFYQTYGYFEMEAKLPVGKGTWPAFWLFNHVGDRRPEMDVMEAYAGGEAPWGFDVDGIAHPQAYAPTVWKGDHEGQLVGTRQHDADADLSAGFHKYAVKWEPNKQTYYFDGKEVLTVNITMSDPMYLMLDLWFGSASGTPDDSTPQGKSNSYEVNYVRAWKFK
jgi:beta-glucanase (GH16 family)